MARIPNTVPILALCALSPHLMAPSLSRCHPPNAVLDALPTGKPPGLSLGLSKMPPTTTSFWTRQNNLCAQRGTVLWPLKAFSTRFKPSVCISSTGSQATKDLGGPALQWVIPSC